MAQCLGCNRDHDGMARNGRRMQPVDVGNEQPNVAPRWRPVHRPPSCRRPSADARCEVSQPAATMPFRPRSRVTYQRSLVLRLPIRDSGIPVEKYFYFSHAGIRARLPLSHCRDGTPRVLMSARPPRLDRRPGHQLGPPCPRTGMPRPAPPPGAGRTLTSKGRKP